MRLVVNESANAAMDAPRSATRCSIVSTIFSTTLPCAVAGSSARTDETPAVADSTSKERPKTLQPPITREFHLLFMFYSRLQGRETGEERGADVETTNPCRHGGTGR